MLPEDAPHMAALRRVLGGAAGTPEGHVWETIRREVRSCFSRLFNRLLPAAKRHFQEVGSVVVGVIRSQFQIQFDQFP